MDTQQKPDSEIWIDKDEVAAILGVHAKTVERYVRDKRIPAYRVGPMNVLRFRRTEIIEIRDRVEPV